MCKAVFDPIDYYYRHDFDRKHRQNSMVSIVWMVAYRRHSANLHPANEYIGIDVNHRH
jgi:hypothetical protein